MQNTPCFNNIMAGREADRSQKPQQLILPQFTPGWQTQSHQPGSGEAGPPIRAHRCCVLVPRLGETVVFAISPLMLKVELILRFRENIVIFCWCC